MIGSIIISGHVFVRTGIFFFNYVAPIVIEYMVKCKKLALKLSRISQYGLSDGYCRQLSCVWTGRFLLHLAHHLVYLNGATWAL